MPTETVDDIAKAIRKLAGPPLQELIKRELVRGRLVAEATAKQLATTRLKIRTGRLRGSIKGSVENIDGWPALVLRAGGGAKDVRYGPAQEYGAVVRPRGRFLTIPVGRALTKSGVLRNPARSMSGLFVIRSKAGKLLLVRRKGKGIEPMFVLHRGPIRITGKSFLRDGMAAASASLPDALSRVVSIEITRPGGGGG